MKKPAARVTDIAGHGGSIVKGAAKVLIGGLPAARLGDPLACPGFDGPKPHVLGNIISASGTVIIEGAFAARQGDSTGCGIAGVSGVGMPPTLGPKGSYKTSRTLVPAGEGGVGILDVEGYDNADGSAITIKGTGVRLAGSGKVDGLAEGSAKSEVGSLEVKMNKGKQAIGGSAQWSTVAVEGSVTGPNNSKILAKGSAGNAQFGLDLLAGKDGRRTGVAIGGAAQISLAEGQVELSDEIDLPFGYSIRRTKTLGASKGSLGAVASGGVYHDAADDRLHANFLFDIEALVGIKFGEDVSFGKKSSTPGVGVPMTPGVIATGLPTVVIGS